MDKRELIHQYFGVTEAYKVPPALLDTVLDPTRFSEFKQLFNGETGDVFLDYFEGEQGDRNALKQDFTPDSVCDIVAHMTTGGGTTFADVCAGVGRLTLAAHKLYPSAHFYCDEMSERTIPFLLANLAINGVRATVRRYDVLSQEVFDVYEVEDGNVTKTDGSDYPETVDCCIMNPPYSVKWSGVSDDRCKDYGIAPKSKADYMFMLDGLSRIKDDGNVVAILPHGVLFRGASEGKIRQALVEKHQVAAVVGLASNLFLNTSIPVCIVELRKTGTGDVFFIDASNDYKKGSKLNTLEREHIDKLLAVYRGRLSVKRYSDVATEQMLRDNDFNMNIPRYVDTYVPEPRVDMMAVLDEIAALKRESDEVVKGLTAMIKELTVTSNDEELERIIERMQREGVL